MAACECQYKQQYQAQIFQCFHIVTNLYLRISSYFSELRGDADEQFEVDTGHGAREHRKVVLVEEIIDCKFQLNVHRFEKQVFLQGDVAHEIFGQVSCQRVVVA